MRGHPKTRFARDAVRHLGAARDLPRGPVRRGRAHREPCTRRRSDRVDTLIDQVDDADEAEQDGRGREGQGRRPAHEPARATTRGRGRRPTRHVTATGSTESTRLDKRQDELNDAARSRRVRARCSMYLCPPRVVLVARAALHGPDDRVDRSDVGKRAAQGRLVRVDGVAAPAWDRVAAPLRRRRIGLRSGALGSSSVRRADLGRGCRLWSMRDRNRQGVHDKLATTFVGRGLDPAATGETLDEVRVRLRGGRQGAEVPARRQGREPRRDDEARACPSRPASRSRTEACKAYMAARRHAARRPHGRGRRGARAPSRPKMGKRLGDDADPLLVSVRSGAPFSMPGMMDTVLNLGLNDDVGAGPRQADRQRALRVRLVPPVRADVRQDRARRPRRRLRGGARTSCMEDRGVADRHRALAPTTSAAWSRRSRASCSEYAGVDVPATTRTSSSATRSKRCSSRGTGDRAQDYRRHGAHPRRPRHRGERPDDGVRQQGRRLRHRRGVHAQPVDRRERAPTATSSRNAQGEDVVAGHPHHRAARRDGERLPRVPPPAARRDGRCSSATTATCATSSSRSSRVASSSCRPASASAPRWPRCAWRSRWRSEGLIDKREAVLRVQPAQLDQLLHPQFDPTRRTTCSRRA